jgi:solute carrier family 35 protein E3
MSNQIVIVTGVVMNILCVVGIVIWNKYITEVDGFNFMVFLSFLHFLFTTVMMRVLLCMGMFSYAPAPMSSVFPVALWSCLSVGFMNLNLQHNSVGFYQLSKLTCIPVTLIVQYVLYKQSVSNSVMLTLVPITFGVGYATVYDLDVNFTGLVFAGCAVLATALAQIFTNTYQKSLECDAMQLLYHTSPIIAMGMLCMSPFFDDLGQLQTFELTYRCKLNIAISCLFALGVNISNYLVLGKTSPLTYQVLGHMKTVCIIILGVVVFNKPIDYRNIFGVLVAMAG